jgi:hypothetical protein
LRKRLASFPSSIAWLYLNGGHLLLIQFPRKYLRTGSATLTIVLATLIGTCSTAHDASNARGSIGQVNVINQSYPTSCAEEDNIDLEFVSKNIVKFSVRATHPSYIEYISLEQSKPDFHGCPISDRGSVDSGVPQKITLYRTPEIWLVGYRFLKFWRSNAVPVIVGDRREVGLQLIQMWIKYKDRAEEILAFYPPDGYWRLRPLPYGEMRRTAYGSSLLIGPVERDARRPYVAIKQVLYDPPGQSFRLDFDGGGSATLKLLNIDQQECAISVAFTGLLPKDRPFAAIRSMFVDEGHSDAARIAWEADRPAEPVLSFQNRNVSSLWVGRSIQSKHNNTAPDLLISNFVLKSAER